MSVSGFYGTDHPPVIDPGPEDNPALDDEFERRLAFSRRVRKEVDELRIRAEAKRLHELELHPPEAFAELYLDAGQLDQLPVADPLIDRVLTRQSYTILRGRDHTFKSFVALDWSWCLATGKRWQGREVQQTRALYIVGEGAHGIQQRKQAWETAWRTRIPAAQWMLRRQALDLHRGGPALDELLDRVHTGQYGLVVVDTLRRVSGRAEGNGSDMGAVVDNLTHIREATADGSILVLAHTDKTDNDTRGYSGIEDDADIVWHAKRPHDGPPMALDLDCTKMKDGPDRERIELTMAAVLDSLVVAKHARHGGGGLLPIENYDTDDTILTTMRETFADTGASVTQLIDVTGLNRSTVYKARGRLLKSGQLTPRRKGPTDYLYLPGSAPLDSHETAGQGRAEQDSTPVHGKLVDLTPESTPVHAAQSTPVHGPDEHESTPVHGQNPHLSTPRPPSIKTGWRGQRPWTPPTTPKNTTTRRPTT